MVEYHGLFDKLEGLTDLETAILLCVVAGEHCIIDTERPAIDDLENELMLIAENVFGLSWAVVGCSPDLSVEEFSNAILSKEAQHTERGQTSPSLLQNNDADWGSTLSPSANVSASGGKSRSDSRTNYRENCGVADVIIAKDLDRAPEEVQLQAFELLRSRRSGTGCIGHDPSSDFLFIPLLSSDGRALSTVLNKHLNGRIFISHYHDPSAGFANLEDGSEWLTDEQISVSSAAQKTYRQSHFIQDEDIRALRRLIDGVALSPDINCYIHNIVVFLRLNRAVVSGISAAATRHVQLLARCLAPFQQADHVCPSLVAAAARKIYRHRIVVSQPENDRSILYGSSLKAVKFLLSDATPENTIERVLAEVEVPL